MCIAAPDQCIGLWVKEAQDGFNVRTHHRTGYFTDFKMLVRAALQYSGKSVGVYVTANAVARKALNEKTRRLAWNQVSPYGESPRDEIIYDRRRLLIDIDPAAKPKDVSATAEEKAAAVAKGRQVQAWLREQGWHEPLVIDSGNGVQLVYKIKLPVDDDGLVKRVLYALAARFDDDTAVIDKAVSSAKTLMRLPGTWNCKGKNTTERPHRLAHIISAPKTLKLVSGELLEKLIAEAAPAPVPAPSPSVPAAEATGGFDMAQAKRYLDKMELAVRTNSDGSSKVILAARAIVVGFNVPWNSDAAWTLLKHYNARCKPPWNLADKAQCQDLRRRLKEAHDYADAHSHTWGYLCRGQQRNYEPLEGPEFPLEILDWDWMAKDTSSIVLDNPPIPYANGLRVMACWQYERADILVPDVLVKLAHWGANPPQHWRKYYRQAMLAAKEKDKSLRRPKSCSEACILHGSKLRHRHYQLECAKAGLFDEFHNDNGKWVAEGPKWDQHFANGDVYRGYWPALIFGTAKPVGLTPMQVVGGGRALSQCGGQK